LIVFVFGVAIGGLLTWYFKKPMDQEQQRTKRMMEEAAGSG